MKKVSSVLRRSLVILLVLAFAVSSAACNGKTAGSSSEPEVNISEKLPLLEAANSAKPRLYGGYSQPTRKYLSGCIDTAEELYAAEHTTVIEMNAALADIEYALTLLAPMDSQSVAIGGLSVLSDAPRAADGSADSVSFTSSFTSVPNAALFGAGTVNADGIGFTFEPVSGTAGSLTVTLKAGETAFVAELPFPAAQTLSVSFDYFTNDAGAFIENYLASLDSVAFAAEGATCNIRGLCAYSELLESNNSVAYSEYAVNSVSDGKFYKIIDSNGLALTFGPENNGTEYKWENALQTIESGASLSFSARTDSTTQKWQIYKLGNGNYKLINSCFGCALTADAAMDLSIKEVNNTTAKQEFTLESLGGGEFNIKYAGSYSLTSMSRKVVLKKGSAAVSVYECASEGWTQVWSDEFDSDTLDRSVWNVQNNYVSSDSETTGPTISLDRSENIFMRDGCVVFKVIKENYSGYPTTGASMLSDGKYGFSYGKMEVRAKTPDSVAMWPAIWLMGYHGNWPFNGEIDVMETGWLGSNPDDNALENSRNVYGTLHWYPSDGAAKQVESGVNFRLSSTAALSDDFHIFSFEWDTEQIRIYVDGMLYVSLLIDDDTKAWGFGDNPHYILLGMGVCGPGGKQVFPEMADEGEFCVDYVRVFKHSGEVSDAKSLTAQEDTAVKANIASCGTNVTAVSPDGKYALAAGWSGEVKFVSAKDGGVAGTVNTGLDVITSAAFSPDGKYAAFGDRSGGGVVVSVPDALEIYDFEAAGTYIEALAFSADGANIIAGGRNSYDTSVASSRYMWVFSAYGGAPIEKISTPSDIRRVAVSPDGAHVAAAMTNGAVCIYNGSDYSLYASLSGHTAAARGLDFSSDGTMLVSSDEEGNILLWSVAGKSLIRRMSNTLSASVRSVSFSSDDRRILAASNSGDARLFTAATGRLYAVLGGFASLVNSAEYSTDGSAIAVASYDGTVRIYREDGALLQQIDCSSAVASHGQWVQGAVIVGRYLLFGMTPPDSSVMIVRLTRV